ncbi:shikimate dehydrogenase [Oceanomicrobium pacificus]|uniref:Shikimate dehydrogenase (NADP(+)) n=1 Tax=Oceanomicrobium pacificus TaxID=2692916 RepID=A0A6B0TSM1_9RHOB|nr:shikimate dehydrogenase [Oceanomicrobium pacificus]MXU64718.1 shikimate dehydrogenase [Oceanomicrobium pacificus]
MSEAPPLAGVIGWPIGHSRSPQLHGYWLRTYGLPGHYVPLAIQQKDFAEALHVLPKLGFKGVNVTVPYKETALALAQKVSDRAALIGAANTIVFREDGSIHADNTDGYGFIQNLRQSSPDWSARSGPALVFGAGGAARAIVSALLAEGAPEVLLTNRTRTRAETLKDQFGAKVTVMDWNAAKSVPAEVATVVNTTTLGMVGNPDLTVDLSALDGTLVTDIVYTPLETPLLAQARAQGLPVVDGLGMLLHQAVPGFESWFGKRPEVDEALRAEILGA